MNDRFVSTDIDIDVANRDFALDNIWYVPAAMTDNKGERSKHKTGVYFQNIPVNPNDGLAVYDYEEAAQLGYFKIDMLPNYIYEGVRNENHLIDLLINEPDWTKFENETVVSQLAQLRDHFDVIQTIKPKSIEDLAVCIALIRPGKRHLIGKSRAEIDREIWSQVAGYSYKKSHAIAYAASIVVQLNLLIEKKKA